MYRRNHQDWSKHIDFILLDLICVMVGMVASGIIVLDISVFSYTPYRSLLVVVALIDALVMVFFDSMRNVTRRGALSEMIQTIRHSATVFALATMYMFVLKTGDYFSRSFFIIAYFIYIVLSYVGRVLWKAMINKHGSPMWKRGKMIVVSNAEGAEKIMMRLINNNVEGYDIVGVVFDKPSDIKEVCGVPVVGELEGISDYLCQQWIDAVYIDCPSTDPQISKLMDDCRQMALPVHYHVASMSQKGAKQFAEKVGGTLVVTTTINYASPLQMFAKRCLDILGGIVGSLIAILIILVVGPIIKIQSPGPILFKQERIGKNGKRFKILKIRSMYMDADERKKELMEKNRVKDGMMFKLDFDPRVIGNKELPDGTRKTGIGEFIRKTSLDEFPQFFNVLFGQMSLVGTRPPTVDEWQKYKFHHRARLACKPGITGMWQVSGRSEITDFEEVVKLDTQYINNWSFGLDIKILFKTVGAVLRSDGAM